MPGVFERVRQSMARRCNACLEINGLCSSTCSDETVKQWFHSSYLTLNTKEALEKVKPQKCCSRLNEQFSGHWIGRRGPVEWPARSPDLTPLDFFFWGYIKNLIYEDKIENMDRTFCSIPEVILAQASMIRFFKCSTFSIFLHPTSSLCNSKRKNQEVSVPRLNTIRFLSLVLHEEESVPNADSKQGRAVAKINTAAMEIHQYGLDDVQREVRRRAEACVRATGGHFEHLL
ncbi:hypothetical protein ANN_21429 [Periplaneta americana]|uniref:Uncharacterized protein n=1 Tax=Periplaneta americana TaxID=6978 RepID=A0ABQ8SFC8_PERAM|nr:hypothetical protein ANN_21429 [Periplaneta americana]